LIFYPLTKKTFHTILLLGEKIKKEKLPLDKKGKSDYNYSERKKNDREI